MIGALLLKTVRVREQRCLRLEPTHHATARHGATRRESAPALPLRPSLNVAERRMPFRRRDYFPSTQLKINGATMVASLSTMNFGVFWPSLPQVIFSFGTAPE